MSSRTSPPSRGANDGALSRRTAILLRPPGPTSEQGRLVIGAWHRAEQPLADTLREFESRFGLTVDRVTLDIRDSATDEISLAKSIRTAFEFSDGLQANSLRVVFDDGPDRISPETMCSEFSLSHFCYAPSYQTSPEESATWSPGSIDEHAVIRFNWRFAPHFLHDILADIAVYRGLRRHQIAGQIRLSPEFQGNPNRRKLKVTREMGRQPAYAALTDSTAGYISLAAAARDAAVANRVRLSVDESETYAALWEAAISVPAVSISENGQDLLEQRIRELTKISAQLSVTRLRDALSALGPGDYLLWVAVDRPGESKIRQAMATAFRRSRYHQGMWRITGQAEADPAFTALRSFGTYCSVERITKH